MSYKSIIKIQTKNHISTNQTIVADIYFRKGDSDQNYFKIDVLQKNCSVFWVTDMLCI